VSTSDGTFDGFLDDYFAECDEHLTNIRRVLLELEVALGQPGGERVAIAELFRFCHSLKGISAMVELRPAEELAHHLEHYLRAVRNRELAVSSEGIEVLFDGTRRLEGVIHAHKTHQPPPDFDDIVARVTRLVAASAPHPVRGPEAEDDRVPAASSSRRWTCTFSPTRELLARGVGVDAVRKQLSRIGTILEAAPLVREDGTIAFQFTVATAEGEAALALLRADGVIVEPDRRTSATDDSSMPPMPGPDAPPGYGPAGSTTQSVAPSHVVRVDLARLDELMTNAGDLVISRARLTDSLARIERWVPALEWRAIHDNANVIDRQLRTLRERIMRVRLVPVGEIFRRMPFVVRDLARETGKRVRIELKGQTTEIDKYLIERMMDPVLHLVRNAVSHGIETVEERIAAGKPPDGIIALSASAAGAVVTLEVADDGRGVDSATVVARARTAGLPVASDNPDPATLLSLICAPGFSTKTDTDRASGRGVGMAVVKTTVEELSGTIELESQAGTGTRFVLHLPLTLAITDALIGRVGDESFAVPQSAVREVVAVAADDVRTVEENEIVPYRGGALTIVRLGRLFGIESRATGRFHLFVIGTGPAAVGLAVDRIVGHREIVVRAIADPLVKVDGIAGATDLGDGRVVLILDPATLSRLTRQRASRALGDAAGWGRIRAR
jgi:two-component system chemotaxis sensor kinase CheA